MNQKLNRTIIIVFAAVAFLIIFSMKLFGITDNTKNTAIPSEADDCADGIPALYQTDIRWCDKSYGDSTISISGCAPTCMSMVVIGLTGNKKATPDVIGKYAQKHGYYSDGTGTCWAFMTDGCKKFGVEGEQLSLDDHAMKSSLENGMPIICSMRPGDFTDEGHFIVLAGVKDDKYIVHDPNSKERTSILWDYETLSHQIKNLWRFRNA